MKDLKFKSMYSSFSVDNIENALAFYSEKLQLKVQKESMGILTIHFGEDKQRVIIYPKPDHQPATFTVLNWAVDNLETAVDELIQRGITFEQYNTSHIQTDSKGIFRGEGPLIAWFKDPAGNILSIMQE